MPLIECIDWIKDFEMSNEVAEHIQNSCQQKYEVAVCAKNKPVVSVIFRCFCCV